MGDLKSNIFMLEVETGSRAFLHFLWNVVFFILRSIEALEFNLSIGSQACTFVYASIPVVNMLLFCNYLFYPLPY